MSDHSLEGEHDDDRTPMDAVESTRPLPGDDLVPDAKALITHGITIDAPPGAIWPWLTRMIPLTPPADPVRHPPAGCAVLVSEEPRALVLGALYDAAAHGYLPFAGPRPEQFWEATWALVLEPVNPRQTRLLARARVAFAADAVRWTAVWMHPFSDFVAREELRRIKRCAEGRGASPHGALHDLGEAAAGALGALFDRVTHSRAAPAAREGSAGDHAPAPPRR